MLHFRHYEVGRAAVQPIHYQTLPKAQFDHLGIYGAVAGVWLYGWRSSLACP